MGEVGIKNRWRNMCGSDIPSTLWPDDFFFSAISQKSNILDIGCGNGSLALHLAKLGHHVVGLDINTDLINEARTRVVKEALAENCAFIEGSATQLTGNAKAIGVAILQAVLTTVEHAPDRLGILLQINRILQREGMLYIADFAQTWHQTEYRERYKIGLEETGELGLFVVRDRSGVELYRAKHFSQIEMVELILLAGFEISKFQHDRFKTRTGNLIDGFKIIAKPNNNDSHTLMHR